MRKLTDLKEFMNETYRGKQIYIRRSGLESELKTTFTIWIWFFVPLLPISLNTVNMRYYRWLFFELSIPKKEANTRYLQLNSTSDFQP